MRKITVILLILAATFAYSAAQTTQSGAQNSGQDYTQTSTQDKPAADSAVEQPGKPADTQAAAAKRDPESTKTPASAKVSVNAAKIPSGSKIYVHRWADLKTT